MMKFVRKKSRSLQWLTLLLGLAICYFIFQALILRIISKDSKKQLELMNQRKAELDFEVPRGIRLEDKELYRPKSNRGFQCFVDGKTVPWASVNDDYCDCTKDGSDEPGTSACSNGRFYCQGSGNPTVKGLEISPCGNVCKDLFEHKYISAQQRLGMRLKKKYVEAGKGHRDGIYGKEGEFYRLSKECFQYNTAKSNYLVCPYRYVREDNGEFYYNMGRRTVVQGNKKDGTNIVVMVNGDSRHCPEGVQRKTQVEFLCGLNDHVMNIHEESECVYTLRFSTPAAC
ncbi:uncharacterized protein [Antedon mediterranea]|uniref:uncharacterized protein isoform X2 n=1 Tax=Antedon mediterranea TaxID=105859 RepID=UPI003AF9E299